MRWMLPGQDTLHLPLYPSLKGPVLPEEGMHPPSPSPGPELITYHPAEEAPCGEVVHLHLGVCVLALLGSLGSLGIRLLQPAPHRHLVAALRALLAPLGDNLVDGDLGPISTTPSTSARVRCPWGMYALKPVRRGMMNSQRWRDPATIACQKSGIYPTFDSAAGLGQIPLIPG